MSFVIRSILTLALIYASYRETGFFTALSFLLVFAALEIQGFLAKRALDEKRAEEKYIDSAIAAFRQ